MQKKIAEELRLLSYQCLQSIANFTPIALGTLQKSFTSSNAVINTETMTENQITVSFGTPVWGKPQGYGAYVEFGTRPHWMPLRPLLDWVRVKGLVSRASSSSRLNRVGQEIAIAKLIQYKIAAKGTRAKNYAAEGLATLGVQFVPVFSSTDAYYDIDPTPVLRRTGAFERFMK